jgi:hypothetical protein
MAALACLWESVYRVSRSGVYVLILSPFIWSRVSGAMRFRDGSGWGTASNFVQIEEKLRRGPRQWLDKRSGNKARTVHGKSKLTETEKCEYKIGDDQSKEHTHYFFTSQRIRPGRSCSQFWILLWRFTAAWKCAKTSPRTLATKKLAAGSQRTVSHLLFLRGITDQKQHGCRPQPTLILCFPDFGQNWTATILTQLRWSGQNLRQCWTPSQKRWEWCTSAEGDGGQELVFHQTVSSVPEIMDSSLQQPVHFTALLFKISEWYRAETVITHRAV